MCQTVREAGLQKCRKRKAIPDGLSCVPQKVSRKMRLNANDDTPHCEIRR